ncbi:MAG: hypothetical protein PHQ42_02300 [Patescibacteria group bacterium]|nr:hypothetical protein [Patescibacteria group bacterium]
MILYLETTGGDEIEIALKKGKGVLVSKKFMARYSQAEKLLPAIDKILSSKKIKLKDLKEIEIANEGNADTSFTSLRIGIATANALGYALGIPVRGLPEKVKSKRFSGFDVIEPVYNKEPNITL